MLFAMTRPIFICTRGSALALAQATRVRDDLRRAFPDRRFELKIIKTTGDKLQTASLANPGESLPKGLFTKELEVALLAGEADIAVHSLKDLPTELPAGLTLAATPARADVRDVMIYRGEAGSGNPHSALRTPHSAGFSGPPHLLPAALPSQATVATSSTRRGAQLRALRPDLRIVEIRGNVDTRLRKLAEQPELAATILAAAGLARLSFLIAPDGSLHAGDSGREIPAGLLATPMEPQVMLPAVGQGAVALEIRSGDPEIAALCAVLNDAATFAAVTAERAFLHAMGGGCQSPVAAYARLVEGELELRAASFRVDPPREASARRSPAEATQLGEELAARLR